MRASLVCEQSLYEVAKELARPPSVCTHSRKGAAVSFSAVQLAGQEIDAVAHSGQSAQFILLHLANIKRLLHTHDQLNQVNRIGAQILLGRPRRRGDFPRGGAFPLKGGESYGFFGK